MQATGAMRRSVMALASGVCVAAASLGLACNAILGFGDYKIAAADASAGDDARALDGSSETGTDAGADACAANPQTKAQLESACTSATCEPFDNASRNTRCGDAGTSCPTVTPPEAGAPVDGSGGADGAPATDAGPTYPSCFSLTQGPAGGTLPATLVVATGSTAIQPYMARVAQVLESLSVETVVYLGAGSCFGVQGMLSPQSNTLQTIGTTATYYDPALDSNGNVQQGTCAIDDPARIADLGISDVFPTTCDASLVAQGGLPNNLHDFFGPVQVMEMVVPASSPETSISSEAAYMVWGFGSQSGVAPWTDATFLLQRSASSGTQNMIGATIGLPPGEWQGVPNKTSGALLTALTNVASGKGIDGGPTSDPDAVSKTMGILASDVADGNRQSIKPLAFQDVGQSCGWFPDTTASSFDKANVRDGHYPIWGPSHLIAYADSNGNEKSAAVAALVDAMNGSNAQVLATLDVIAFYAKSHIIPTCAMHVQRADDGHGYQPYAPVTSCSCYYDLQATGQTSCVSCKKDSDCASAPGGATTCVTAFGLPAVGYCEPPGTGL
jgi:ABC-type phosphate transport system substrate-binding protein